MDKSITWWTGWIILYPLRVLFLFIGIFIIAIHPRYWDTYISEMYPQE